MKTNDEILEQLSCCTIEEDADLDVKENFYYKYEDVIKAMNEARKQVNGDSMGSGQSNIADVISRFSEVKNLNIPAVMGELTCDSCGCHPNVIYTTSKGRFCERCKPAS